MVSPSATWCPRRAGGGRRAVRHCRHGGRQARQFCQRLHQSREHRLHRQRRPPSASRGGTRRVDWMPRSAAASWCTSCSWASPSTPCSSAPISADSCPESTSCITSSCRSPCCWTGWSGHPAGVSRWRIPLAYPPAYRAALNGLPGGARRVPTQRWSRHGVLPLPVRPSGRQRRVRRVALYCGAMLVAFVRLALQVRWLANVRVKRHPVDRPSTDRRGLPPRVSVISGNGALSLLQ